MGHAERACAACGHENRAQARFCESCGRALERSCHACGTEIRPAARFCDACGAVVAAAVAPAPARRDLRAYTPKHLMDRILTSRGAIEGERKQVTVFFADVTGSMELAEQVDPEEWHRILDRFFEILTEGVHRFEGTVNQYTGDGVMALFGAPLAHEDHAHRACYAALHLGEELRRFAQELKRERGLTFATRMGLNSGEVVVGTIGDDLRMDYTAQGQVVGIAARLQTLADPGKAYVSEHTAALVEGFFALGSLGAFRLKGVTEPLRVFSLDGVGRMRTRLDVSRARGLSRFVGRRDEMAVLEGALARAIDGQAQVVGVVAEAGTGKSRLCGELGDRCRERGLRVHEARGVSHGKLLPFLPLLELLRAVFRLDENDSSRDARQKIAGSLVLLDRRFEEALPLLFEFLGVPDPERPAPIADPADQRRQLFGVIARLVRALGEREPNVMLLEDLHWFDDGTVTFVETLIEAITGTKTLLVLNFRPEFRAPWMEKASYQQLPLSPLGPAAIAELLDDLLGNDPSVAELRELIRGPTGGNPFFLEEAVQALIEAGSLEGSRGAYRLARPLPTLRVPPTVQALLAARIDRLPAHARGVLQDASVIGKRFAETILRRVAGLADGDLDEALRTLRARDFVFEEQLFPEVEYAFKHPLTQEVAYGIAARGTATPGPRQRRAAARRAGAGEARRARAALGASLGGGRRSVGSGTLVPARRGMVGGTSVVERRSALARHPAPRRRDRRHARERGPSHRRLSRAGPRRGLRHGVALANPARHSPRAASSRWTAATAIRASGSCSPTRLSFFTMGTSNVRPSCSPRPRRWQATSMIRS